MVVERVYFDPVTALGLLLRLLLSAQDVHRLNCQSNVIAHLIKILLEEVINYVSYIACIVCYCELLGVSKLALLVIWILCKALIELGKKCLVVHSFHHKLFFHDFEERRLCLALEQIYTTLVIREADCFYFHVRQFVFIQFLSLCENLYVELLLEFLVCIVDAKLLKRILTFFVLLESEDVKEADLGERVRTFVCLSLRSSQPFIDFLDDLTGQPCVYLLD